MAESQLMEIWSCSQPKDVREYMISHTILNSPNITFFLDSDSLDLSGSLFVGGLDSLDTSLSPPPQIWSSSLQRGFVGCLKDLIINGADIDIVAYAHEQNSGV